MRLSDNTRALVALACMPGLIAAGWVYAMVHAWRCSRRGSMR